MPLESARAVFSVCAGETDSGTEFFFHVRDLPKERWVYTVNPSNGAQTLVSQTRFNYDRYDATTNHAALVNRTNISGLQTGYTTTWKTRGNATSMERWLNTTSSWMTGWSQYDIAGNVVKTIDSRNDATVFDYTDNFGAPNGEARTNTAPSELGTLKSFALVSKVTNPLSQIGYTQYDYYLENRGRNRGRKFSPGPTQTLDRLLDNSSSLVNGNWVGQLGTEVVCEWPKRKDFRPLCPPVSSTYNLRILT